jgi:hypothetical protein
MKQELHYFVSNKWSILIIALAVLTLFSCNDTGTNGYINNAGDDSIVITHLDSMMDSVTHYGKHGGLRDERTSY